MSRATTSPPEIESKFRGVVAAAADRKAVDVKILRLDEVSSLTDYFLICSATSERQVKSIADAVLKSSRKDHFRPLHVEGYKPGSWILLDYGDFVVHIFSEATRAYYGLERLWADAPDVTHQFAR